MDETPVALGYRMPAEWEPHAATWIAWPHNDEDWPGKFSPIRWVYCEIVRHLSKVERVQIVVRGVRAKKRVADHLDAVGVNIDSIGFFKCYDESKLAARYWPDIRRKQRSREHF